MRLGGSRVVEAQHCPVVSARYSTAHAGPACASVRLAQLLEGLEPRVVSEVWVNGRKWPEVGRSSSRRIIHQVALDQTTWRVDSGRTNYLTLGVRWLSSADMRCFRRFWWRCHKHHKCKASGKIDATAAQTPGSASVRSSCGGIPTASSANSGDGWSSAATAELLGVGGGRAGATQG
eukprot:jgi/Tetstr1/457450/TSEL_044034.t1